MRWVYDCDIDDEGDLITELEPANLRPFVCVLAASAEGSEKLPRQSQVKGDDLCFGDHDKQAIARG
jgi:hypothetical protein